MERLLRRRRPVALLMLCAVTIVFILWEVPEYNGNSRLQYGGGWEGHEPLIFLYNTYFGSKDWDSFWDDGVDGPNGSLRTLRDCARKCIFTSDRIYFNSTDFVLVHVSSYAFMGGKPVLVKYSSRNLS